MRWIPLVTRTWSPARAVYVGVLLLLGACTTGLPALEPAVDALVRRVTHTWKPRERGSGGLDGLLMIAGMRVHRHRHQKPSGTSVQYAGNRYTQASGVSFSTVTGEFTKSSWYFGAVPSHRFDTATATPATAGALTTALAGLSGVNNPIIQLTVGNTYTGSFHVPAKNWTGTLIIRSGTLSGIPSGINGGTSTRVSPSHASSMAQVTNASNQAPWIIDADGDDVWIEGLDIYQQSSSGSPYGIFAGHANNGVNTEAKIPERTAFVHNYIHLATAATPTINCKGIYNETEFSLTADNYVSGWRSGSAADCNAYYTTGWHQGQQDIVNNYLEGSGENAAFGGADTQFGGVEIWLKDVYFAYNHCYTPSAWNGSYVKKLLWESKKGERFTVVGNVFDGCWEDGQTGHAWGLKNTNQNGGNTEQESKDYTFRFNIVRNAGAVVIMTTAENFTSNKGLNRVEIRDNLCYDLQSTTYDSTDATIKCSNSSLCTVTVTDWAFCHNTLSFSRAPNDKICFVGSDAGIRPYIDTITFQDNLVWRGTYGFLGQNKSEGTSSMAYYWSNYTFSFNALVGSGAPAAVSANYPGGNWGETAESSIGYTSVAGDDYSIADGSTYGKNGSRAASDNGTYPGGKAMGADIARVLACTSGVV